MNDFGNFLYSLRKGKGMTQQELADRLNVTNKAVSKWETGEAFPETAQLVPLSDIFGVTVDELLRGRRTHVVENDAPMSGTVAAENAAPMSEAVPAENTAPMSEAVPAENAAAADMAGGEKADLSQWRITRAALIVLAACAVVFALAYLIAACLSEEVARREVVVRASVCLLLMALAFAGSCAVGIFTTQKIYAAAETERKKPLARLRWTCAAGILVLMLGVCCFVFFQLYAMPEYYHNSALITGMIAGCVFVVGACCLIGSGVFGLFSSARKG